MFYSNNAMYKIYHNIYTAYSLGAYPLKYGDAGSCLVSYNKQLYIFGMVNRNASDSSVVKWDGNKWVKVTNLPDSNSYIKFVECNGKVHLIRGSAHYAYDGSNWTQLSGFPLAYGNYVSYKNNIYGVATQVYGSSDNNYAHSLMLYKYDGTEWIEQGYIPY